MGKGMFDEWIARDLRYGEAELERKRWRAKETAGEMTRRKSF